jgi:hypothetical protein
MSSDAVRVGDKVRFRLGSRTFVGQVRENRGPIGVGGRLLFRVDQELGTDHPFSIELPAEEIQVVELKKETG